jgi:hypothetical protein
MAISNHSLMDMPRFVAASFTRRCRGLSIGTFWVGCFTKQSYNLTNLQSKRYSSLMPENLPPPTIPLPLCPFCGIELSGMNIREVNSEQWMTLMADCCACGKLLAMQIVGKVEPRIQKASRIIQQ